MILFKKAYEDDTDLKIPKWYYKLSLKNLERISKCGIWLSCNLSRKRYNKTIKIKRSRELKKYNLSGKWNDYIAVQKEILKVLRKEGFFDDNVVINIETGMKITVSPKDIRETFGNGNKFQRLPKELKEYKVVTIGNIKDILKKAYLQEDNVENIHFGETDRFAYFRKRVIVDRKPIIIRISVKKKVGSNHFHIHHIDVNEKNLE